MRTEQWFAGWVSAISLIVGGVVFVLCAVNTTAGGETDAPSKASEDNKTADLKLVELALSVSIKRADGGATFVQGEPISIQVRLINQTAETDYIRYRERAKVEFESLQRDKKTGQIERYVPAPGTIVELREQEYGWAGSVRFSIKRQVETGGSDVEMWREKDWRELLVSDRKQVELMRQIGERGVHAVWCLGPELTRGLIPGRYEVTVHYDTTNVASVRVPRGDLVASGGFSIIKVTEDNEQVRLACELARYYVKAGNPHEAIRYAKLGIAKDPSYDRSLAYTYLGRAFEMKGMVKEAISAYEEFLKHNSNTHRWHYPHIIKHRVEMLKLKLEQEK